MSDLLRWLEDNFEPAAYMVGGVVALCAIAAEIMLTAR